MSQTLSKPDLLLLNAAVNRGGMERIVCGLSRQFTGRGWSVRTVVPQARESEALVEWCARQGVAAEASPSLLDAAAPHGRANIKHLQSLVREADADVVNPHYGDNFISLKDVLAVRLAGARRCVVSVHHPTPWDAANRQKRRLTQLASFLCHAVVANSRATRQVLLEAGVPASKLTLVPCGVPPPAALATRASARARLGLPAESCVIGSLARLVKHKGLDDLIEACARLPEAATPTLLAVAGAGPERAALEARAAARLPGRAVFLGHVPDVQDVYAASDIFALPSHMEGFGLVYVEAAFHGVPSVGTKVGGIPDAIADGETGFLVPVGDVAALAAALSCLRSDERERERLGEAARARAYAQFTEALMADRYQAVYDPAAAPGRGAEGPAPT